jgi:hypothetical protein
VIIQGAQRSTTLDDSSLDRRRALTELFTAPPDLLDWTAFSLGTRSVISALDLCAAAVWRLSDGQPLSGGKEQDLDGAFLKWAQLTPWSAAGLAREGY